MLTKEGWYNLVSKMSHHRKKGRKGGLGKKTGDWAREVGEC